METGCGSGLGLGLVSHELLAGELTLGYEWSHTVRNLSFFLSFSSLPVFLDKLGWMPTVFSFFAFGWTTLVWIPFVFLLSSPSETETCPARRQQYHPKKLLQHSRPSGLLSAGMETDHVLTVHGMHAPNAPNIPS
jgi:hypothetical protein